LEYRTLADLIDFAVIFDMDGVMVNSNPHHKIALTQFCLKHGYFLTEEEMKQKIFGRTNKDWLSKLFGRLEEEQWKRYEAEKESLFREIFAPHIKPVDGLINFLDLLDENKITKAIATSAPTENVDFTLEKTGTAKYFETIIDGNSVNHSKPHPEIYLKTAEAINYLPKRCVVIEDSLSGVKSAQKAGCKVIGITTTHTAEEFNDVNFVINDFYELDINMIRILFS
jgi:beta-phosphoglucomutase